MALPESAQATHSNCQPTGILEVIKEATRVDGTDDRFSGKHIHVQLSDFKEFFFGLSIKQENGEAHNYKVL